MQIAEKQKLDLFFVCNCQSNAKWKHILYLVDFTLHSSQVANLCTEYYYVLSCCPGTPFGSCTHIYSNAEHHLHPTCPLTNSTCTIVTCHCNKLAHLEQPNCSTNMQAQT